MSWDPTDSPLPEPHSIVQDIAALVARLFSAGFLLLFYGLNALTSAWARIWDEETWPWEATAEKLAVPAPLATLTTAAVLLMLACVGLLMGLFSRLAALMILLMVTGVLHYLQADRQMVELALVYMLGPSVVLILGGGRWSMDGWMRNVGHSRR